MYSRVCTGTTQQQANLNSISMIVFEITLCINIYHAIIFCNVPGVRGSNIIKWDTSYGAVFTLTFRPLPPVRAGNKTLAV